MLKYIISAILFLCLSFTSLGYYEEGNAPARYIPSILVVEDDSVVSELEKQGVVIWYRRADMVLCLVPRDAENRIVRAPGRNDIINHEIPDAVAKIPGVKTIEPGRRSVPTMDIAKECYDASLIASGEGLPQPFTGKGVVVGFCDTAFDPNHINFIGKDGKTRVKRLVYYNEPVGIRRVLDTPGQIAAWTTDNEDAYHGTHVAGIMTGSYNDNGYGGMAPDAEIVATTSKLYDAGILAACEDIIAYADSVGKPAVINLSIGSYNGPHDGTSLFCRYLDLLGEKAIICIAAGNEADNYNSYRQTFSENLPDWRVVIEGNDWVHFNILGMTDAWSDDSRPISARFLVYDTDTGTGVYESDLICNPEGFETVLTSDADSELAEYMQAEVSFRGYVSELNGRWVTEVVYQTASTATAANSDGKWARYRPGLEFSAAPGVHADINSDCSYSSLVRWKGYPAPNADLSVSDIATGSNVIVVGMYNSRSSMPTLSGTDRVFDFQTGTVNEGSGYGTLIDGRVLPHVVAPGAGIISSSNRYYNMAHPDLIPRMCAVEIIDGETYYWGSDAGTSMATPYVAGTIATWLEADPTLDIHKMKKVLEATNLHEYADALNPRNGLGWLQPYEGIKYVLGISGVEPGKADHADLKVLIREDKAEIYNPAATVLSISVFSMDGIKIVNDRRSSGTLNTIDLSELPKGMYVLSVSTERGERMNSKFVR